MEKTPDCIQITPKRMLNFRMCLTKEMSKQSRYDWKSAFIRWVLNIKQTVVGKFIIPKKFKDFVPVTDIEYIKKNFNDTIILDQNIYETCLKTSDASFDKKSKLRQLAASRLRSLNSTISHANESLVIDMYDAIGALNTTIFLSVPPKVIKKWEFVELFGSPFNFVNEFHSPFESDKLYGSKGNMFDVVLEDRRYVANPPFDETIINLLADKLVNDLSHGVFSQFTVAITIPVWDNKTQRALGEKSYGADFPALDKMLKPIPGFKTTHEVLVKSKYPYWSYSQNQYIYVSNSHLIVISNESITAKQIADFWAKIK